MGLNRLRRAKVYESAGKPLRFYFSCFYPWKGIALQCVSFKGPEMTVSQKEIDQKYMRRAIHAARAGVRCGQTPFGASVVKNGRVVCCEHNEGWLGTDITAHAEIVAIREACRKLKTVDLSGCTIYSTCEPCPMCFSACHWARIDRIVFGATIADAARAGFNELLTTDRDLKALTGSPVRLTGRVLLKEARALFVEWQNSSGRRTY